MGFHVSNSYLSEEGALFREGLALFEVGYAQQDAKLLRTSCQKLAEAVRCAPTWAQAWHIFAKALFHCGILTGNRDAIWEATLKIEKALELTAAPAVHGDAGLMYEKLAEISQEACDYVAAIAHFEKGKMAPKGWVAFGRACTALAYKLDDRRLLIKAAHCLRKGLPEGHLELSRVLRSLFFMTREESLMREAWTHLCEAHALSPENHELHLEKIELLIETSDFAHAVKLCEEFPQPDDPHLLSIEAEALALLGAKEDRADFIHEAQRKIDRVDDVDSYVLLHTGKALFACARHFCDLDFYHQALETFQEATSLDRTDAEAWKWMGKSAVAAGELTDDDEPHAYALRFYQKALALKPDHELYFAISTLLIQEDEAPPIEQAIGYLDYLQHNYPLIYHNNPDWLFYYGVAHNILGFLRGDEAVYKKALLSFRNVHTLAPNYPNLHHQIALLYSHMGQDFDSMPDFYRALRHFEMGSKKTGHEEPLYIDWGVTWLHLAESATEAKTAEDCFELAEKKFKTAAQLGSRDVYYPLACLYSLKGQCELTLHYLNRGHKAGILPPLHEIEDDGWLETFRFSSHFQEFLALLHKT